MNYETGRLAHWNLRASEFDFEIVHRPGKLNLVPDHASRYPTNRNSDMLQDSRLEQFSLFAIQSTQNSPRPVQTSWNFNDFKKDLLKHYKIDTGSSKLNRVRDAYLEVTKDQTLSAQVSYVLDSNGLMYKMGSHKHPTIDQQITRKALVIPAGLRNQKLHMFHEDPLSGHLGHRKTNARMLPEFGGPVSSETSESTLRRATLIGVLNQCQEGTGTMK
jgi:hypothetical protein